MGRVQVYVTKEQECERLFAQSGQFWHLCTPGDSQEIIFRNREDFAFGMTSAAAALMEVNNSVQSRGGENSEVGDVGENGVNILGCNRTGNCSTPGIRVRLYAFALMSNHIHELLCGTRQDCLEYFDRRKAKIKRYFAGAVDLSNFKCQLIEVKDLKAFRDEVAYIHRNGYVNNREENPFSYEWSSGAYYFNRLMEDLKMRRFEELTFKEKREVFRSRVPSSILGLVSAPCISSAPSLFIFREYVSPWSFCEIRAGERLFRDSHQYMFKVSRDVEAYSLIAKTLGDSAFLNDEEMYRSVWRKSDELFNEKDPRSLPLEDKKQLARIMHSELRASNGQIQRILRLERYIIDEMFPKA